jgi:3-oxoacyl-[acyl-carrier protein] reductase
MQAMQAFNLAGRVALVTGAGVGLGRAIAEALAEAGAFVGLHYNSSRTGAEEALAGITKRGGSGGGVVVQGDLTEEDAANATVDAVVKQGGRLDILINNAGALLERAKIEDCSLDLWNRTLTANLTSAFLVTRRSIPHLRASGKGSIVNVLSLSVQTGGANGAGAYGAAKGGLHTFTRTLARELAPQVRTNAVMPGVIETRHHEVASSPEAMENYRKQTPLARNGKDHEVATAVLFLASDAGSFTNGAVIDINGGRFLR